MARPFVPIANWNGVNTAQDQYLPVQSCSYNLTNSGTEVNAQVEFIQAGTLKQMSIRVSQNLAGSSNAYLRINGATATQTIPITAATTGTYTDITHSDDVESGDDVCIYIDKTTSTMNVVGTVIQYQSSDNRWLVNKVGFYDPGGILFSVASVTRFLSIQGTNLSTQTGETASTHMLTDIDFLSKNLRARVPINGRTTTTTIRFRNNGSNGTQVITVPGSTTGNFSDITHEDFVISGTRPGYSVTTGGSTGNFQLVALGCDTYATASEGYMMAWAKDDNNNYSATGTRQTPLIGAVVNSNSTVLSRVPFFGAGSVDKLRLYVSVNAKVNSTLVTLQKNGSNTTLAITIPAGSTGEFSNLSVVNFFTSGQDYQLTIVTTDTANLTIDYITARIKFNQGNKPNGSFF